MGSGSELKTSRILQTVVSFCSIPSLSSLSSIIIHHYINIRSVSSSFLLLCFVALPSCTVRLCPSCTVFLCPAENTKWNQVSPILEQNENILCSKSMMTLANAAQVFVLNRFVFQSLHISYISLTFPANKQTRTSWRVKLAEFALLQFSNLQRFFNPAAGIIIY